MEPDELKRRTKTYGIAIINLAESLLNSKTSDAIGRQLIRSGASIGANYRAACRAKPRADFISKMGTVEEETDETLYWLEIIHDLNLSSPTKVEALMQEGNELLAIAVSSINTA